MEGLRVGAQKRGRRAERLDSEAEVGKEKDAVTKRGTEEDRVRETGRGQRQRPNPEREDNEMSSEMAVSSEMAKIAPGSGRGGRGQPDPQAAAQAPNPGQWYGWEEPPRASGTHT